MSKFGKCWKGVVQERKNMKERTKLGEMQGGMTDVPGLGAPEKRFTCNVELDIGKHRHSSVGLLKYLYEFS